MSRKSLGVVLITSLLAIGCNSQQGATTMLSTTPAPNEELKAAVPGGNSDALGEKAADDQEAQRRAAVKLKSIAKAFYEYQEHFGHFPPAASTDADGKPLLSWRVHLLPFLDACDLYEQFHLDEPWNSDHNVKLVGQMPAVYRMPDVVRDGQTPLMVFTGDHAVFGGKKAESRKGPLAPFQKLPSTTASPQSAEADAPIVRRPLSGPTFFDLTDGTSNTILAVCAGSDKSVPWTKPDDLHFQPENPAAVLGTVPENGFVVLFWDSRVERLPKNVDPVRLNSLIDSTELARKRQSQETRGRPAD